MSDPALGILRQPPPRVRQTLVDSCWGAVLQSWSGIDSRFPALQEGALVTAYGEGPTGGITPSTKIPLIAEKYGLRYGGFNGQDLRNYLLSHLPHSHIFCAYTRGAYAHAVLIYRLSGQALTHVSYMDPDGGYHRWHTTEWFAAHGPMVLMRK